MNEVKFGCIKAFARLARMLAKSSPCKRRGVACVILNYHDLQVVAWGVNGPAGMDSDNCTGKKDGCGCVHSEVETIINAGGRISSGDQLYGCIMIVSRAPCVPCASVMVNSGLIKQVYVLDDSEPGADGIAVLMRSGIEVEHLDVPEGAELGLRDQAMEPSAPYGLCPRCGAPGAQRERRPNGNDKCENGHTYPSSTALLPTEKCACGHPRSEHRQFGPVTGSCIEDACCCARFVSAKTL